MPPIPDEMLSQLQDEIRRLEDEIFEHKTRIKEIKDLIGHATKLNINWTDKAKYCLDHASLPMTTNEILHCIFYHDTEELDNLDRRRNYIMKLSLALNRLCNKGVIIGEPVEGYRGKIYYTSEWIDGRGLLKIEHTHKVKAKMKLLEEKV